MTEAVYYILLSLHEPMHGYAIMQHVSTITDGRVVMGPGTLYGALNALVKKQWITTTADTSTRKKEYVISKSGRQAFQEEHQRLEKLVADGKEVLK